MFHAFKGCIQVRHSGSTDAVYFPCRYLRRMIVAWMAHNRCYVLKHKLISLQSKYGIEGGDLVPNPISYREYLRMMLRRTTWGEDVVLYCLVSLFDLCITMVNSAALEEYRYCHNLPLHHADVILVYNGRNHYLFAGKWMLVHTLDKNAGQLYTIGRLCLLEVAEICYWMFV